MKIVIAKALVQSLFTIGASVVSSASIMKRELEVELGVEPKKETSETPVESKTPKFNLVPHFVDITSFKNKMFSVSRTDDELTIEVKDDFIVDMTELGAKIIRKTAPLFIQKIKVLKELEGDFDLLDAKWQTKVESSDKVVKDTPAT